MSLTYNIYEFRLNIASRKALSFQDSIILSFLGSFVTIFNQRNTLLAYAKSLGDCGLWNSLINLGKNKFVAVLLEFDSFFAYFDNCKSLSSFGRLYYKIWLDHFEKCFVIFKSVNEKSIHSFVFCFLPRSIDIPKGQASSHCKDYIFVSIGKDTSNKKIMSVFRKNNRSFSVHEGCYIGRKLFIAKMLHRLACSKGQKLSCASILNVVQDGHGVNRGTTQKEGPSRYGTRPGDSHQIVVRSPRCYRLVVCKAGRQALTVRGHSAHSHQVLVPATRAMARRDAARSGRVWLGRARSSNGEGAVVMAAPSVFVGASQ